MADITINVPVTVPDAYVPRVMAWLNAQAPLMVDSGEVDEQGDPIMVEQPETAQQKFLRIAGAYLRSELRLRVLRYERRAAEAAVSVIDVQ